MDQMSRLEKLHISEVRPGMTLAEKLLCPEKGGVLLGAGIAITDKVQEILSKRYPNLYLHVMVPMDLPQEKSVSPGKAKPRKRQEIKLKELETLEKFPSKLINSTATDGFVYFCQAMNSYLTITEEQQWKELMLSYSTLFKQILRNPRSLRQIISLRLLKDYFLSQAVNVTIYSLFTGKALGYQVDQLYNLGIAAAISDIGFTKIPLDVKTKDDNLTREEWHIFKQHVHYSVAEARKRSLGDDIVQAIYQHHERMDGSGYPLGIKGKDIHSWAQIIAVADTFDTIMSKKTYRMTEPYFAAVEILMAYCHRLNPRIIRALVKNINVFPQRGKIKLSDQQKGEIIHLNKEYPDRPIIMVPSNNDYMGRRYVDLTKELTLFIEDVD